MRPSSILVPLALAASIVPTTASAETQLLEVPTRYLVIPPSESNLRHLKVGDTVLDVPLRWQSAAVLSQPVQIAADDRRENLKQGQALVETRLLFDDPTFAQAATFCVPRLADPLRKSPLLGLGVFGAMLARSTTDGQFCLVDRDRDGIANHSVLINAGSPAARTPVPIAKTHYVLTPGAAVSEGDSFTITYSGGKYFQLAVVQQGKARRFDTITFVGPSGRMRFNKTLSTEKMADGSIQVPAPGVTFVARNYNKANKSIDILWPAISQPIALPIPDVVKESNGFSY